MTIATRFVLGYAALCAACSSDEIDPVTKITSPRVLAITTEPSALVVDGEVHLAVMTVDPDGPRGELADSGRPVDAVRVRACAPWKFVVDPGRDCVGDDAVALERDGTGRFAMSAFVLAAAFPAPPDTPVPPVQEPWRAALAAGISLRVPVIAEVDVDGVTLVAKREVEVVEDATTRRNPQLVEVRFDGVATSVLRSGQTYALTATLDGASLDLPDAEPETPAPTALEEVTCHLYSPSGELADPDIAVKDREVPMPETVATTYTAGPPGSSWLFVVAIDETDGLSAVSVPLTIE